MSFVVSVMLASSLTTPIPQDLYTGPEYNYFGSPDLYEAEPSIIAMEPSAVRNRLHALGFDPITEMRFDNGRWKVKAYWMGKKRRLEVDQMNGQILSDRPD